MFANEKQREQFVNWLKRLVTYPVYWCRYHKFWYCTKIYFAKRKETNEYAYVYVGKKRKFLRDIHWKFSEWFETIRIKLRGIEDARPKVVDPDELGVIQVLAVYCNQNQKWEKVPRPYCEETRWITPHDGIFPEAQPFIYDPDTREPQYQRYHDWHKPVICLLPRPARLCQNVKAKLKDLKKEYKLSFTPPRDRYELYGGGAYWKWESRES